MLPQQLFINWQRTMVNNLFEATNLIQDNLQHQTDYILDNIQQYQNSEKKFFYNFFQIQKDFSKKCQKTIDSTFHTLNQLFFDEETLELQEPTQKEKPEVSTSSSSNSTTSRHNTKNTGPQKTSSDSRYGKTKKSKTQSKTKKTGKKET